MASKFDRVRSAASSLSDMTGSAIKGLVGKLTSKESDKSATEKFAKNMKYPGNYGVAKREDVAEKRNEYSRKAGEQKERLKHEKEVKPFIGSSRVYTGKNVPIKEKDEARTEKVKTMKKFKSLGKTKDGKKLGINKSYQKRADGVIERNTTKDE
jgi:hypothetical protein